MSATEQQNKSQKIQLIHFHIKQKKQRFDGCHTPVHLSTLAIDEDKFTSNPWFDMYGFK